MSAAAFVERPILFSGPMVKAIIEDRKTQTRRIVRGGPQFHDRARFLRLEGGAAVFGDSIPDDPVPVRVRCPYGTAGDRLWVRERMRCTGRGPVTRRADSIRVRYEADGTESAILPYPERLGWDPAIGKLLPYGGYREASRITLEVTGIRVERLQDITEEDAKAEGVQLLVSTDECPPGKCRPLVRLGTPYKSALDVQPDEVYRAQFAALWDDINGRRATWASNPFVWVVSFRRLP